MYVQLTIESKRRCQKPTEKEFASMTEYFGKFNEYLDTKEIANRVGNYGSVFSPTVFSGARRCGNNFSQMQLFSLDFDSGVSYSEIKERAEKYDIPILFAYHTFSHSSKLEKFRIVLLHEVVETDNKAAEIIIRLLMKIFPECDARCKDVARLYCGGKNLFFYNDSERSFNIADLARSYYCYEYELEYSNYTRRIETFAKELGIETYKHCLIIERVDDTGINEINTQANMYIYIGRAEFPSFRIKKRYRDDTREVVKEK